MTNYTTHSTANNHNNDSSDGSVHHHYSNKRKSILSHKTTKGSKFHIISFCCVGIASFLSLYNYILITTITIYHTTTTTFREEVAVEANVWKVSNVPSTSPTTTPTFGEKVTVNANERKVSKVLMGIFTSDLSLDEIQYRTMFRDLLQIHYPKVCSFYDYSNPPTTDNSSDWQLLQENCELMYTFVLGGGGDSDETNVTEITLGMMDPTATNNNVTSKPPPPHFNRYDTSFLASRPSNTIKYATDAENADMTFLNIRYVRSM